MGLRKWLARTGAPGGTARWAAKGYAFFRSRHPADDPDFPDAVIFRLMVATRYEGLANREHLKGLRGSVLRRLYPLHLPNQEDETYLLDQCNKVAGLMGLVIEILRVEAALMDNEGHVIYQIFEAIASELEKTGLSRKAMYGRNKRIGDYGSVLQQPPE